MNNADELQVGIEELEYHVDPGEDISVTERLFQSKEGEARKQGPGRRGEQEARRHHANGNCKKRTPRNHRKKTEVEVREHSKEVKRRSFGT